MKITVSWITPEYYPSHHCHYATTTHRNGLVVMDNYRKHNTILKEINNIMTGSLPVVVLT